jgi:hypothetical protein
VLSERLACPDLKNLWDSSRKDFVAALQACHARTVLDWGFPVSCLPWVAELQQAGVRVVWFAGNVDRARDVFVKRGGIAVSSFETQVKALQAAGLPASLDCTTVQALSEVGVFKDPSELERHIFA